MKNKTLIDYCPLCGEQLLNNCVEKRQIHDRVYHPEYVLAQSCRIKKYKHEGIKQKDRKS